VKTSRAVAAWVIAFVGLVALIVAFPFIGIGAGWIALGSACDRWSAFVKSGRPKTIETERGTMTVRKGCYKDRAPEGFVCTRERGHAGPCAAVPITEAAKRQVDRGVAGGR
jgi:hypothetical protein